jgi:hypothetical protein
MPDAILFCDGPRLEKESKGFIDLIQTQLTVNKSINRLKFQNPVELIYSDPELPYLLKPKTGMSLIHPVHWIPKMGEGSKEMKLSDYPQLVHLGYTIFTAIHYLACKGKKFIYAPGLNLEHYPSGGYAPDFSTIDGTEVFNQIRHRWAETLSPFLFENGITIFCSAFREINDACVSKNLTKQIGENLHPWDFDRHQRFVK